MEYWCIVKLATIFHLTYLDIVPVSYLFLYANIRQSSRGGLLYKACSQFAGKTTLYFRKIPAKMPELFLGCPPSGSLNLSSIAV